MGLVYEISPCGRHVRILGPGVITPAECIRMVKKVLADSRCRSDSTALVDLRAATYQAADQTDVIGIAKAFESYPFMLKNHIAILARQSVLFPAEILSAYLRKAMKVGIRVFVELEAAEAYCRGQRPSRAAGARPG
jgi:hypothetical protein